MLNETQHDRPSVEKHSAINAVCRILVLVMLRVIMLGVRFAGFQNFWDF
jgi:hypothetical protein